MPRVPHTRSVPRQRHRRTPSDRQSQAALRAQIDTLRHRLEELNVDAETGTRRLLGDAARFLGAALARLQEVDQVMRASAALPPADRNADLVGVASTDVGPARDDDALLASAFRHAMTGMVIADVKGRPLRANHAMCRLLGYTEDEIRSGTVFDLTHDADLDATRELVGRLLSGDVNTGQMEKRYVRKDGSVLWGLLSLSLVRDGTGQPLYFVSQIEDVSERRAALAALYESEQRFQSAFDDAPIGMVLAEPNGRPLRVNRALGEMVGYSAAELLAMRPNQISHPDDIACAEARHALALRGERTGNTVDLRYIHKSGEVVWGRVAASIVRDADGSPSHMIVQIENITQRKQIEHALQENEARFRTLAETAAALIFIIQDARFCYANAAAEALTGYSRAELFEGDWFRIIAPEYRDQAKLRAEARLGGEPLPLRDEVKIVSKSGTAHWVEFSAAAIVVGGEPAILGTAFDITERRRVERALRKSDERFALAVAGAHDGIWDWRFDRAEVYCSPRLAAIVGLETIDSDPAALLNLIHPEDRAQLEADVRAHAEGRSPQLISECRLRHRDGTYRWVLTRGVAVRGADGMPQRLAGSLTDITERKEAEQALRESEEQLRASEAKNKAMLDASPDTFIRIRSDGTILDVKGDTTTWRTPADEVVGRCLRDLMPEELASPAMATVLTAIGTGQRQSHEFEVPTAVGTLCIEARIVACSSNEALCSLRDITARRRAEDDARQRLTELAHVARVSTMGEMTAQLAHELNQPLMAIVGFSSGCALRVEAGTIDPPELQAALRHVSQQAVRAGEILRRLRDFVRKTPPQRSRVDANDLAREVAGLADSEARSHRVTLKLVLDPQIPAVAGDPIQIEQVMLNLIRNGIEAMLTVEEPRVLTLCTRRAGDDAVAITVNDRGRGLQIDLDDACAPFVSTKPKGLGLGLSISRSIVEAHGGALRGWSDSHAGTTFEFTVPLARGGLR